MRTCNETPPVQTHDLKTWPQYFSAVDAGAKTFEIRRNDRGFRLGDTLRLREFDSQRQAYTGRETTRVVSYVTDFAQQTGYVVLGLAPPLAAPAAATEAMALIACEIMSPYFGRGNRFACVADMQRAIQAALAAAASAERGA